MPIETGRYCGYCTDESGQRDVSTVLTIRRAIAWSHDRE